MIILSKQVKIAPDRERDVKLREKCSLSLCAQTQTGHVSWVYTRPVHKNLFLEFPKMQGRFMLHFVVQKWSLLPKVPIFETKKMAL